MIAGALDLIPGGREASSRIPRVALAGEANSGKTTLVNFLLQTQLLLADIVAGTACPTLLRFGETAQLRVHREDGSSALRSIADLHRLGRERVELAEVYLPSPVLRRMEILDLPGFASSADAGLKGQWLAAADIHIWCTPATQAWKASEQAIWLSLAAPKAFSFLVLTHRDLLSDRQLDDVAGRIARDSARYFSRWAAVATPQAIAAQNPRGQIVEADVWASSGVEDFMKKLMDLLQSVVTQRRDPPPPPRADPVPAGKAGAPHPLTAFAQLRHRVLHTLGQDATPQQAAAIMARELDAYGRDVLKPWIAATPNAAVVAEIAAGLVPEGEAEILGVLVSQPADPAAFTPAMVLRQIEAELGETLQIANAQSTS